MAWPAVAVIAAGAGLYLWCLWVFATVGRGTPGPWDAPRRVVAVGPYRWVRNINIAPLLIVIAGAWPYRWVRNPINIAPLLIVIAGAWLFPLAAAARVYSWAAAISFHLFVIGYEGEPTLRRRFGEKYVEYRRSVLRWFPRRPRRS